MPSRELFTPATDRKIAIVAKAPQSKHLAPFDDPTWEIWSLGDNYPDCPRWDAWFEIHDIDRYRQNQPYWSFLTTHHGKPIYTDPACTVIPDSTPLPKDEILARFSPFRGNRYFTNTVSWMIATALLHRPAAIGVWGVEMEVDHVTNQEYGQQRPSCEYWIGLAEGLGVEFWLPESCMLLKTTRLYGVEANRGRADLKIRARQMELDKRLGPIKYNEEQALRCQMMAQGACMAVKEAIQLIQHPQANGKALEFLAAKCNELAAESDQHGAAYEQLKSQRLRIEGAKEDLIWVRQLT